MRTFPFLIAILAFAASCSTDVDLEGPWRDIPVVYGFLSRQDTAHYIRVERAFLPQGADAREAALIADSLYYGPQLVVQLERVRTGKRFTLRRVDGNLEGYRRTDGPFATSPNWLYKIRASDIGLQAGETIRLVIERGDNKPAVTAQTVVLEDLEPRSTSPASPVNMGYERQVNFAWTAGPNAKLFDVRLTLHYRESLPGNPSSLQPRTLEWVLADALARESDQERISLSILGVEFYRFLAASLPANPAIVRVFEGMDIRISAAGQELVDLLAISSANTGLTSFQEVPVYSNLSEGRGIFSSRSYATRTGLVLDSPSTDSLRNGIHTRKLNFR